MLSSYVYDSNIKESFIGQLSASTSLKGWEWTGEALDFQNHFRDSLCEWPPESAGREMAVQWMTLLCCRCYILTEVTGTEEPRTTHLQRLLVNLMFPLFRWWPPSGVVSGRGMRGEASACAGILCPSLFIPPSVCLFMSWRLYLSCTGQTSSDAESPFEHCWPGISFLSGALG